METEHILLSHSGETLVIRLERGPDFWTCGYMCVGTVISVKFLLILVHTDLTTIPPPTMRLSMYSCTPYYQCYYISI